MYELLIIDRFSSAHFLRGYEGECENLHGHTWKIEVMVKSDELDSVGLAVDFKLLKQYLKEITDELDHVCLNDLDAFKEQNPSTENMARYIYDEFVKKCSQVEVAGVRVWESESACATYYKNK